SMCSISCLSATITTLISSLSLHDALPIYTDTDPAHCGACDDACATGESCMAGSCVGTCGGGLTSCDGTCTNTDIDPNNCGACGTDRKSTRLNSSHVKISYAVFCLKKKNQ